MRLLAAAFSVFLSFPFLSFPHVYRCCPPRNLSNFVVFHQIQRKIVKWYVKFTYKQEIFAIFGLFLLENGKFYILFEEKMTILVETEK